MERPPITSFRGLRRVTTGLACSVTATSQPNSSSVGARRRWTRLFDTSNPSPDTPEVVTFTRRTGPLTWRDDPIVAATQAALLPRMPHEAQEGWIRVLPQDPSTGGAAAGGAA